MFSERVRGARQSKDEAISTSPDIPERLRDLIHCSVDL